MNGFILAARYSSEIPALGRLKWEDFPVQGHPGIHTEILYQTKPNDLILLCVSVFCLCMSVYHMLAPCLGMSGRVLDPLKLELEMVVGCHEDPGS